MEMMQNINLALLSTLVSPTVGVAFGGLIGFKRQDW